LFPPATLVTVSPIYMSPARTASTLITIFGAITNAAIAIQVLAAWRTFKWEPESEWESSGDKWQLNGLKLIWALLLVYFSSATSVCTVGLIGVVKAKSSYLRFYRDYSIADFSFCAFSLVLATYAAFLGPARAGVCEELSHHPELMRDMLEMGLNLENCERWLERAVFAVLAVLFVVMVVRLHFLLAISNYYSHVTRRGSSASSNSTPSRIFLLAKDSANLDDLEHGIDLDLVYAPVSRHSLPKELQYQATEAWVSRANPASENSPNSSSEHRNHHHHQCRHHRHHSTRYRSGSLSSQTGTIKLDVSPNEGLFPDHTSLEQKAR